MRWTSRTALWVATCLMTADSPAIPAPPPGAMAPTRSADTPGFDPEDVPFFARMALLDRTHRPGVALQSLPPRVADDWRAVIDSLWGPGLPTENKLSIFETTWSAIDKHLATFHDIHVDWDSLHAVYAAEISQGVSRGRFAAIMNHLCLALRESHTNARDLPVMFTPPDPGVPLLFVGGWGWNTHFGAGLTPLPDRSLLVYKAVSPHPLGLRPGDIVLGYEGRRWAELYPELLAAQLPITGWWWGSSPSSYEHSWLMSAGMNWHLFDAIDVVRHATGDTLHLSTAPLAGLNTPIFCSEQLPVPGVPMPDYSRQNLFTWGIVEGTSIGYIYGWGWFWNARTEFLDAVTALRTSTTGLIIDFRMNYGGNMFLSNDGLSLLFNSWVPTIGLSQRCNDQDHFAMCPLPGSPPSLYYIPGNPSLGYDKPIAVLTGPGAVSSGDQVALRMKFHPRVRVFGKSTATAFNGPVTQAVGSDDWLVRYAAADAYLVRDPTQHLTHREFEVDEEVWLTPEDVAEGRDTVVESAIDWINSVVAVLVQDFDAVAFDAGVRLTWRLWSDEDIRGFRVYRRDADGGVRAPLVPETLLPPEAREHVDRSPPPGSRLEYTLVVVRADGSEILSRPVEVRSHDLVLALYPSEPNPFNATTAVRYDLPVAGRVALRIHDVRGRHIRTLVLAHQGAGRHATAWDGRDEAGRPVASGVYLCQLATGSSVKTQRLVLLRP